MIESLSSKVLLVESKVRGHEARIAEAEAEAGLEFGDMAAALKGRQLGAERRENVQDCYRQIKNYRKRLQEIERELGFSRTELAQLAGEITPATRRCRRPSAR